MVQESKSCKKFVTDIKITIIIMSAPVGTGPGPGLGSNSPTRLSPCGRLTRNRKRHMAGKRQAAKGKGKKKRCAVIENVEIDMSNNNNNEKRNSKSKSNNNNESSRRRRQKRKANMKHDEVRIDERGDARRGRYLARCEREETRKRFKYCNIDGKYIDE